MRVAITTGDVDGIGLEITTKALAKLGPKEGVQYILWRAPSASNKDLRRVDSYFDRVTVSSWPEALKSTPSDHKSLIDICSNLSPAAWVEQSAKAGHFGHIDALATAPLSKITIKQAGFADIGHTEILRRVTNTTFLFMAFVGEKFSVLLVTGHGPISEIAKQFSQERLNTALMEANHLRSLLDSKKSRRPLALVGLNPHAGENGLIGSEELLLFKPSLEKLRKTGIEIDGPLVPDVAYQEFNWKKYSVYVAPYHDQGLIPFKMVHHHSGVHVTLGLPFVRTSVDHGTAKDLFGKNKADANSMVEAIKWAVKLGRLKKQEGA